MCVYVFKSYLTLTLTIKKYKAICLLYSSMRIYIAKRTQNAHNVCYYDVNTHRSVILCAHQWDRCVCIVHEHNLQSYKYCLYFTCTSFPIAVFFTPYLFRDSISLYFSVVCLLIHTLFRAADCLRVSGTCNFCIVKAHSENYDKHVERERLLLSFISFHYLSEEKRTPRKKKIR